MNCPICDTGTLIEKFEEKDYGGYYYSLCFGCLSELATPEQVKRNNEIMNKFLNRVVKEMK